MSTSIFKAGAEIAVEGRAAVLLRKLDNDYWQIEEVKTKRIFELTTHELQSRYASGTLIFASEAAVPSSATHRLISLEEAAADSEAWEIAKVRRMYVLAIIHLPNSRAEIERYVEELWVKLQTPPQKARLRDCLSLEVPIPCRRQGHPSVVPATHRQGQRATSLSGGG